VKKRFGALALTFLAVGLGGCDPGGASFSQTASFQCVELNCVVTYTVENLSDRAVVLDYNARLRQTYVDGEPLETAIEVGAMRGELELEPHEKREGTLQIAVSKVPNSVAFGLSTR